MKHGVRQRILAVVTLIPLILISTVIFRFSSQTGEQSTRVSNGLTVRLLSLFMDVSELSDEGLDYRMVFVGSGVIARFYFYLDLTETVNSTVDRRKNASHLLDDSVLGVETAHLFEVADSGL